MSKKVLIAMSGGVDSSAAAALLMEAGHEVSGATLTLFSNEQIGLDSTTRTCCSLADVQDARRVAYKLGFEHYVFNFGAHFNRDVIGRFVEGYVQGRTPNPCIDCNRYIKFSRLLERAELMGMDCIATGHYARVEFDQASGRYLLKKAKDATKDQSYVLYAMTQEQLAKTLFPLGELLKSDVRAYAQAMGLATAEKPDSQDICFVRDGDYGAFLKDVQGIDAVPGDFVDKDGNALGKHRGLFYYTIGQRRGLNLSFGSRKYVVEKDKTTNTVTIGDESDLYRGSLTASDVNLISMEKLEHPAEVTVKTRYSQLETGAVLYPMQDDTIRVEFDRPQRAIAPGQAVVFYQGDVVVGGGTILLGN